MIDMFDLAEKRCFMERALKLENKWYIWAGDDPQGFDCSGTVVYCLQAIGRLKKNEDLSAEGLWQKFKDLYELKVPREGSLAFWPKSDNPDEMGHVVICINQWYCLTADGGGKRVTTMEEAVKANAFIRVLPIDHRKVKPRFIHIFKEGENFG